MAQQPREDMDILFDMFTGRIDENKQYYTEQMFNQEHGLFALTILIEKGILTAEEYAAFKKDFIKMRNNQLIKELKGRSGENDETES